MLRAIGNIGGKQYKLHSFAEESDVGGTVNITPFTDLILANVAGELAANHFDDGDFSDFTPEEIEEQETQLQDKLSNVLSALGVEDAIDLLRTQFNTDHSGLDAVLDIIRIETDPETDIATITNFIDGQSIQDDISDAEDDVVPLVVEDTAGLSSAQTDLLAMSNRVATLSSLFASSLPQVSQLDTLFATNTLNDDQGKSQFLTDLSTDPSLIGISFGNVTYEEYDQEAGTSIVQFSVTQNSVVDPEPVRWFMAKNDGVWQFQGNQEIADIWFGFICHYTPEHNSTGCGVNVGVEDNDFSNTPNAEDSPIASAKFSILRNGELISGSEIYLGLPDGYSAGELAIYDDDYGDDYMGFGSALSDIPASMFQAGDVAKIELFTEALDISSAQNPQIDQSATPVQTVTRMVITAPVSQASAGMFPSVSSATLTKLAQYSDGDLDVEWTVPSSLTIEEVWLEARQEGNDVRIDDENVSGDSGTTTITLNTSSLDTSASNFIKELRVYGVDAYGQSFLFNVEYEGVEGDEQEVEDEEEVVVPTSLAGTWEFVGDAFNRDGYNATFLTLTESGEFFFFNQFSNGTEPCREAGYEYGTYSISEEALNLSKVVDTNGCIGIFDSGSFKSLTIVDSSYNTVVIHLGGDFGNLTMQRVVSSDNSIIGAWHEPLDSVEGNGLSLILLFLDDNTFYIMDANPSVPTENDFSYGDYEFDVSSNELTLIDVYNATDSQNEGVNVLDVEILGRKFIIDSDTSGALNRVGAGSNE